MEITHSERPLRHCERSQRLSHGHRCLWVITDPESGATREWSQPQWGPSSTKYRCIFAALSANVENWLPERRHRHSFSASIAARSSNRLDELLPRELVREVLLRALELWAVWGAGSLNRFCAGLLHLRARADGSSGPLNYRSWRLQQMSNE